MQKDSVYLKLHQLRGRVGRSKEQGYCYLLSEATHSEQKEKIRIFRKSS